MLTPDQFEVNKTWIAIRINEPYLLVQDIPYDIYILIDAASTFTFGHVVAKVADQAPVESEVEALFEKAWGFKKQWPKELIMPESSSAKDVFRNVAKKNGIDFNAVPLSELFPIVGELKESFADAFGAGKH